MWGGAQSSVPADVLFDEPPTDRARPGAAAATAFVLFDSVAMLSDAAAGYTPWTPTPAVVWPLFFGSMCLIADQISRLRIVDAVSVGRAPGLVFLARAGTTGRG
jgi:hypothetical protein